MQNELTYLSKSGHLLYNETEVRLAGFDNIDLLNCQFRCFNRKYDNDFELIYLQWKKLIVKNLFKLKIFFKKKFTF